MADKLLGGIVINEILADPNSSGGANFDTDGNGVARGKDEFVELANTSNSAIDISGLELWDAGRGNWFTFPPGTILQAGAHAMVITKVQNGGSLPTGGPNDLFFDAGRSSLVLNNVKDNVVVYDPGNDQFIQATYNGDTLDNPPTDYTGFSATATRVGAGEDFGHDIDGYSIQRAPDGSNTFVNNQTPTPGVGNVCFAGGTRLRAVDGLRPVEKLRAGDLLLTRDHGLQPVRWVWAQRLGGNMMKDERLRPVRIRKGALGAGLPHRDLLVSRQHRLLVRSRVARRIFGTCEVLCAAKDLLGLEGISLERPAQGVVYHHILMDRHEVLFAEGAPAESLYLGAEAIKALEPGALEELGAIFGLQWPGLLASPPKPARPLAQGGRMRRLAFRIVKNRKPLLETLGPPRRNNAYCTS